MSIFNPEMKEAHEFDFEANRFSDKVEARLQAALQSGKEVFADIILCPMPTCGNPLKIVLEKDIARVSCVSCGWTNQVTLK